MSSRLVEEFTISVTAENAEEPECAMERIINYDPEKVEFVDEAVSEHRR